MASRRRSKPAPAPRGAVAVAKKVSQLAAKVGPEKAAAKLKVHITSVRRIDRAYKSGRVGTAIKSERGLNFWEEHSRGKGKQIRHPAAQGRPAPPRRPPTPRPKPPIEKPKPWGVTGQRAQTTLANIPALRDKQLAKIWGVSRQKATAMRQQIEAEKGMTQTRALELARQAKRELGEKIHVVNQSYFIPNKRRLPDDARVMYKPFKTFEEAEKFQGSIFGTRNYTAILYDDEAEAYFLVVREGGWEDLVGEDDYGEEGE